MNEIVIKYDTLALTQQVLQRQAGHAGNTGSYLANHADISDCTGLLLSMFDPLSQFAVQLGTQAATSLHTLENACAGAVGDIALDAADTDGKVGDSFSKISARLTGGSGATSYPDLGGPDLPAAGSSAPDGYGDVASYYPEKIKAAWDAAAGGVDDVEQLVTDARNAGTPGRVTEQVDASSFLVTPQAPDNFVQDLRWSAGALLGSIDWVAEKFLGFSILDRYVFHPFAGDWQGIYRASEAWHHSGAAMMGIAKNHAGLVAQTPTTWEGLSGNSFRAAMGTIAGAGYGLSYAYDYAGDLVHTISTACKLACAGIGALLNMIADKLMKMAAEAATPVFGWIAGAVTAYDDINDILKWTRRITTLIETITSAIQNFVEAKAAILDKATLLERLAEGMVRTAA